MKGRLVPGIIISLLFLSCHRHLVRTEEKQQHYSLKGNLTNSVIDDSLRRFKKRWMLKPQGSLELATRH